MNLRPAGRPLRIADVQRGFGRSIAVIGSGVAGLTAALMANVDPDREILKTDELWYFEEREDAGDWFRRHGWDVTVTPAEAL